MDGTLGLIAKPLSSMVIVYFAMVIFSASVGDWVNNSPSRLKTLSTTIVVNRGSVILASIVWLFILSQEDIIDGGTVFILPKNDVLKGAAICRGSHAGHNREAEFVGQSHLHGARLGRHGGSTCRAAL